MRIRTKMLKWILVAVLLGVPLSAWALYKPVRVMAPELIGVACPSDNVCLDETSRYQEAATLYHKALQFVNTSVGTIRHDPRVVFCSTVSCYHAFGLDKPTVRTTPFGIVVSPRGCQPFYVRHEMIHHLQIERLGLCSQWRSPEWFIEGMAYALSEDPRAELTERYQQDRARF